MIYIANPIYDTVFKYLMSDDRAAKCLLSALLGQRVVELQLRKNEYASERSEKISIFRIDFAATVEDEDGGRHLVLIELQKTWLETETLRFRQYLGVQYSSAENMSRDEDGKPVGIPIVAIYLLGHRIDDSGEPVIYVRRNYFDSSNRPMPSYEKSRNAFIESLSHDSIIVQIPDLTGKTRNYVERILNVFDQSRRLSGDAHYLTIDEATESEFDDPEEAHIRHCLLKAGTNPDIRLKMNVEDEILSEVEKRDTLIMQKDIIIKEKENEIAEKENEIAEKKNMIAEKDNELAEKKNEIAEKENELAEKDEKIAEMEKKMAERIKKTALAMRGAGMADEAIAEALNMDLSDLIEMI